MVLAKVIKPENFHAWSQVTKGLKHDPIVSRVLLLRMPQLKKYISSSSLIYYFKLWSWVDIYYHNQCKECEKNRLKASLQRNTLHFTMSKNDTRW